MRTNEHTIVCTSKIVLVPYSHHHVATYHEWMKDPSIQTATASEPLSLEDEYSMQKSWRIDTDKLTFILCTPSTKSHTMYDHTAEIASMVGDVNMFVSTHEEDDTSVSLVGELELMIAIKDSQGKGYGRAALLTFLRYVLQHESDILQQFSPPDQQGSVHRHFDYFAAKIGAENERSLYLFESMGFERTVATPNFFGEFELRNKALSIEMVSELMTKRDIEWYGEEEYTLPYNEGNLQNVLDSPRVSG